MEDGGSVGVCCGAMSIADGLAGSGGFIIVLWLKRRCGREGGSKWIGEGGVGLEG